jgi:hypothetical protein
VSTRFSWALFVATVLVIPGAASETPALVQQAGGNEDCQHATILQRLARIYGSSELAMITKETNAVCAAAKPQSTISWPNKERMKSSTTWFYPNGNPAIRGATWLYPNKKEAKTSSGVWSYPDGDDARPSGKDRQWALPDRQIKRFTLAELQKWACGRVPDCTSLRAEIGEGATDAQILAALELAWLAR